MMREDETGTLAQLKTLRKEVFGLDPFPWTPDLLGDKESMMSTTRPPYPSEFRQQMVELVQLGRSPEELAREFEPSAQAVGN